ncbi:hypothetical protein B9Z55_017022 [Caenorhabditis nigoni]|uniref:Uncharacterized protein n=1 Tax=Caenorhabditis nigoni TaxID=1611254 RepID=A0A2G5T830_9PELO|nr:hypothetical protein B9Z55_017022 [Caenorhabditis nigoni]
MKKLIFLLFFFGILNRFCPKSSWIRPSKPRLLLGIFFSFFFQIRPLRSFRLPDRGLSCPPTCPLDVWTLVIDCLSDPHVRPRFASTTNASITTRLSELHHIVSPALFLYPIPNQSVCTCIEHHCQSIPQY